MVLKHHHGWFFLILATVFARAAEIPELLNFQGRIAVGSSVFDGIGRFKFALINSNATKIYWQNAPAVDQEGQPDLEVPLTVTRGLYAVMLGDTSLSNMAPLSAYVFTNRSVYLRTWFNDGTNGAQALVPDQRIAASGYAMMAGLMPDKAITAGMLATGALQASNLVGLLNSAQLRGLDASKIVSGRFDVSRLPEFVASIDSVLASVSNALYARLLATNALLVAEIAALSARTDDLAQRIASGSNGFAVPPGLTLVSSQAQDANLIARGYISFTSVSAPAWLNGTPIDAPSARYGHTAVWTGDELIVWGGNLSALLYSGSGGIYDADQDQWRPVSPLNAPTARGGHTAVWTGQEMIIWGGFAPSDYLNSGGRFQPTNQLWASLSSNGAPAGREGHIAAWTGSKMVVWGGPQCCRAAG